MRFVVFPGYMGRRRRGSSRLAWGTESFRLSLCISMRDYSRSICVGHPNLAVAVAQGGTADGEWRRQRGPEEREKRDV